MRLLPLRVRVRRVPATGGPGPVWGARVSGARRDQHSHLRPGGPAGGGGSGGNGGKWPAPKRKRRWRTKAEEAAADDDGGGGGRRTLLGLCGPPSGFLNYFFIAKIMSKLR